MVADMFEAGAHYGYGKARRHPSVASFIYTTKNKTDIINLEDTKSMLAGAVAYAKELAKEGKILLFVGTKPESADIVEAAANSVEMPYVTERWIGVTLSNWTEIKKNLALLEKYRKRKSRWRDGKIHKERKDAYR